MFGREKSAETNVKKCKFKELKVYSADEWMAGSTKKYRTVFDRQETTYLSTEFSFYNKLFDESSWDAKISLKAFALDGKDRKELCNLESQRAIAADDNIVYVRDGWGNATPGNYWTRGDYLWEAYIDGEMVGSKKFYVEDVGVVTVNDNPYFSVESLKLYQGPDNDVDDGKRRYLTTFSKAQTQYVWLELKIKIKTPKDFFCEIFHTFYDDCGGVKGKTDSFRYIEKGKDGYVYTFTAGWGSNTPGSWKDKDYRLNVVFMDTLIASVDFDFGENEVEGVFDLSADLGSNAKKTAAAGASTPVETLEDVMKQLDELIGLSQVKDNIRDHVKYLDFIKLRNEKGFHDSEKMSLHSVFTGNPGTGKTTVVTLLGKIYNKMGLLSKGQVLEVDRNDLVGEYIGQTAPKVKAKINEARGGILFIDEAYMLARADNDSKDYGKEVIEVLLKEMSDGPGDIAIMVAGYPAEMEHFLESNPGLRSRFGYYFKFDDYLPDELMQIADCACKKRSVTLSDEARKFINEMVIEAYRNRDNTFGNARFAYSIIDEGKTNLGLRLINNPELKNLSDDVLSRIELTDVEKIFGSKQKAKIALKVNENLLKDSLGELNEMIGIKNIKDEINELVKLVRYYNELGKDVLNKFSLHSVFTGNPGTGKTSMARIIGNIYKALGLLERGHVVECGREALIAGYVGQTGIKTKAKIDEAKDGVLFIDEAYSLAEGGENDFGKEAIEVILKNMEDMRGRLAVIVAGYPENMLKFLESNPGLKSRFDRTYQFNDYNPEDMMAIAKLMLSKESLTPDVAAEEHLTQYLTALYDARDKFFGNARTVRNVVAEAVKRQNLRLACMDASKRTPEMIKTLTIDDVAEFEVKEKQRSGVGFKLGSN